MSSSPTNDSSTLKQQATEAAPDEPSSKKVKMLGDNSTTNEDNSNNDSNDHQQQQQDLEIKIEKNGTNNNNNNNSNDKNNSGSNNVAGKSKRVYVANVPFDVKWSELKDLFREKVGNVTYCTIFENEEGKSRGCGLLEFQDPASAKKAIDIMHRSEFKGRELVVKEDLDCERDRFGRIITNHGSRNRDDSQRRDGGGERSNDRNSGRDRGDRGDRNDRGDRGRSMQQQHQQQQQQQQHSNSDSHYGYDHSVMSNAFGGIGGPQQHHSTYGLSQQFLDSLGISLPLNNRIFVANLDYKVDQSKLEEIFKLAGKVAKVKLSHDSQGQSRGYGTVEYEHPVEAVQAISMFHNQKLYARTMSVRMDKYECEDDLEALPSKLPSGLESIGKGLGVGGQPLNIAKSIMNAALVAPPHLAPAGPTIPQMHPQAAIQQQPAALQQAVIAAQMQQLQQQQQQQQQQQHHQQQQQHAAVPQAIQQALPQTMQHQLQQSLPTMQQQYQIHQLTQPTQQTLQPGVVPPTMAGVQAAYSLQQLQANAVRAPAANVYQQPQPTQQQPQQPQANQQPQQPQQQQPVTSAPAANLSVYSTFERQFREASAPQNFTRN